MLKVLIGGFLMGALSVLAFHQGTIHLLYNYGNDVEALTAIIGRVQGPGWDIGRAMANPPVAGLHIPQFFSAMFWGGIWGILIAAVLRWTPLPDLFTATLIGAVGCTLVAVTLVAQARGVPMYAGGNTQTLLRAGLINAAFGFGTGFLLRPLALRRMKAPPPARRAARPPPLRRQA
ncbi:hypothetical protein [Roseococcus thiosulfatophilus]|uniref:hypothetical protein n=1 Tax=Roseococcus thiosulfatophilus TaxID=35813 RepID=UPI001A8D06BF|nr:hypothetical protein [Roseococcus thiosulfatophilus]